MNKIMKPLATAAALSLVALVVAKRSNKPRKAEPVKDFNVNKYLGKWYEIARLDYRFERDLTNTAAHYTMDKETGDLKVINTGYDTKAEKWKAAHGTAKFRKGEDEGALKVSFFGPFYSGYNVIAVDKKYRYALVAGKNLDYLWILSRQKSIPESVKLDFLKQALEIGYDVSKLIWVEHDKKDPDPETID